MPITALPPTTVREIGSASVIADPCSIVKELLDNSLDAGASSIFIDVSQNTVDVVQVKDNGHGIPSEDHAFVCKRTFTSKIQTIDDLKNIGGSFLGFRGEALASAAELSGSLTVTTRTETESVGSSIKYGRNGEPISTQRASHPVGTSVRIMDFFKNLPVRRQTALKNATKTLTRIKKMLQSYATAHPSKRLSFKVLKAKNESNNWMYAPGPNATIVDAVLKVAGKDVASSCTLKKWPLEEASTGIEKPQWGDVTDYEFMGLLPKPDSEPSKLNNGGQYFIVDGRPVSTSRGIGQSIFKLYKSYLRYLGSKDDHSSTIKDPFFCLQMKCPQGTYDVNIEPAKDGVLFEDSERVFFLVEEFYESVFGEIADSGQGRAAPKKNTKAPQHHGFELLMARKDSIEPVSSNSNVDSHAGMNASKKTAPSPSSFKFPFLLSNRKSTTREHPQHDTESTPQPSMGQSRDLEAVNPWSITRLNGPSRPGDRPRPINNTPTRLSNLSEQRTPAQRRTASEKRHQPHSSSPTIPSPSTSHANSISPTNSHDSATLFQYSQTSPTRAAPNPKTLARQRDKERYGNGALDTWFERITQPALRRGTVNDKPEDQEEPSLTQLAGDRFGAQRKTSENPLANTESQSLGINRSESTSEILEFPDSPAHRNVSTSNSPPFEAPEKHQEFPVLEKWASRLHNPPESQSNTDLEDALGFERRKKEAIQKRQEQIRNGNEPPSSSNPHQSRYLAARAVLNKELDNNQEDPSPVTSGQISQSTTSVKLNPHDPRAYLMRQQTGQSKISTKAGRTLTSKLPFEKVPENSSLHDTCLNLPAEEPILSSSIKNAMKEDLYTKCGNEREGFTPSDSNLLNYWTQRLLDLIDERYTTENGTPGSSLQLDFSALDRLQATQ